MTAEASVSSISWDEGLTTEQLNAVAIYGQPVRMLAGPGTGKTYAMTRHILYLVQEHNVTPEDILAITFTRSATFELSARVRLGLGEGSGLPRIVTLHSFALGQLVKNSSALTDFSGDLRIADDWEDRRIIAEDIKGLIKEDVASVEKKFRRLSADWETLNADRDNWIETYPDPRFLAAWNEHRRTFEYVMRNELVYRLKRAIDELGSAFNLEGAKHLVVDEYQDLNKCDLAVIQALVERGAVPYVAGDDDQSIYGFRHAFPLAIRQFPDDHDECADPRLTLCKRCDKGVIRIGEFVAGQDYEREEKVVQAEPGRPEGEVAILRFQGQGTEARGIARLSQKLLLGHDLRPEDILILLRSDKSQAFSKVLISAFESADIPVAAATGITPLDKDTGRRVLAVLRLAKDPNDSLALRTILQLTDGIGQTTWNKIYALARSENSSFAAATRRVCDEPSLIGGKGNQVAATCQDSWSMAGEIAQELNDAEEPSADALLDRIRTLAEVIGDDPDELEELIVFLEEVIRPTGASDLQSLFQALQSAGDDVEQNIKIGKVNILTMHKAKGLTAKAVFVTASDERLIPGRNSDEPELGDERRLLYVSLTRAEHFLFATFCTNRTGQQSHSGRQGVGPRRLTRFLRDGPVIPVEGSDYVEQFPEAE